jgi:XkdW protein
MNLFEKIKTIYPSLTDYDFSFLGGTIHLQNDSDGKGDYIKEWNHPTLPRPTEEQLA